ncbi:hypothetical protein [Prevotella nigrescens]|uniref:hypothetical protein n=1 Tax=Prevotella nigrescens TaxID=28133 RepID=UPI0028DC806B|nr:hypothetical protein [Prevotella nigrescens]
MRGRKTSIGNRRRRCQFWHLRFCFPILSVGLVAPHPPELIYRVYSFLDSTYPTPRVSLSPSDLVFTGESDPKSGMAET